jgi:hypothetical protein
VEAEFKDFYLVNAYFPNSQRDHARLPYKLEFCDTLHKYLAGLRKKSGKHVVLTGDLNIAHREIDLKNPASNRNNAGFLPEERQWMDRFLEAGHIDTFRHFTPDPDHYTWWSYRPGVREKNIGWRLDYFLVDAPFISAVKQSFIQPEVKGSDHCPVGLNGIEELAKNALRLPSRLGFVQIGNQEKQSLRDSAYAVAYGLCVLGAHTDEDVPLDNSGQFLIKIWKAIVSWVKQFLP